jgi:hypothetical protein
MAQTTARTAHFRRRMPLRTVAARRAERPPHRPRDPTWEVERLGAGMARAALLGGEANARRNGRLKGIASDGECSVRSRRNGERLPTTVRPNFGCRMPRRWRDASGCSLAAKRMRRGPTATRRAHFRPRTRPGIVAASAAERRTNDGATQLGRSPRRRRGVSGAPWRRSVCAAARRRRGSCGGALRAEQRTWGRSARAARRVGGAPGDRLRKAGEKEVQTEIESCAGKSSRACKANPCAVGGDPGSEA